MFTRASGLISNVFLILFVLCAVTGGLHAQIKAPFMLRYQTSIKGNMTQIANNVLSTTPTGNYNGTLGNHSVSTVFVDVDTDTSTFNSSNATLTLPAGLVCPVMKKVFLYWSAADFEDPGFEPVWDFNKVKLKVPGDTTYTTVVADQVIYQGRLEHFYNDPYTCVKDITSLVASDPTGTYWVANVKAKYGTLTSHGGGNTGTSGGWIIVVVYESTSLPQKNIAIFDGYVHVATEMAPNPLPFSFSGFQTVPTGNVNVDFMFGSLEGDWDLTGDYCEIQRVDNSWLTMSSALRQTNNFFHSIIGLDGAQFLNRVPASQNTLGFDADKFPIPNAGNLVIGNSQTSATVRVGTNQEIYGMFLIGLVVDVWYPEILTIFNIPAMPGGTGGSVNAGDTVTFAIQAGNNGNDGAQDLVLSTVIPPGLEFLQVNNPVPAGVVPNYNNTTKTLTFNIPDNLVGVGDPPFDLQYNTRAITDCLLLQDSLITHPVCQVTATYHGIVNLSPQVNLSSTELTSCGLGNLAPAAFTIIAPPVFPVAINDSATTTEDTPVWIPVLANDTDCDNNINSGSLAIISGPNHGTASVFQSSGNVIYTPAANYNGHDTLRYLICDFDNQCDTAWVYLTVTAVNDLPVVSNEAVSLCQDTSVSGNVLFNDADPADSTVMTASVPPVAGPSHGTLSITPDGSYTYTPFPGYSGADKVVILVCDSGLPLPALCGFDTLFISVTARIQALAGADLELCNAMEVNLSGNSPLTGTGQWMQVSGPDTATITPAGSPNVTVTGLVPGLYEFSYSITNGECSSSDTLVVRNEPPTAPAFAGNDQSLCIGGTGPVSTSLAADQPPEGSGAWSQAQGPVPAIFADPADPHTLVSGLEAGAYLFRWTVTKSICPAVSDSVQVSIEPISTASAGDDRLTCGAEAVTISGSEAFHFSALHWGTSGTGTFDDATSLHPAYTPGPTDIAAGSVYLVLTTASFAGCPPASDSLHLVISKPPMVNAGPDGATCSTIPVGLNGAEASDADSLLWVHNGQGQLHGGATLTPGYTPAPGESGTITFVLSVKGRQGCINERASDERQLRIYLPVTVDAGADQSVDAGAVATLNGNAATGSGDYEYSWEPAGFLRDNTLPQAVTIPLDTGMTFTLTVKDLASGCSGLDTVRVTVRSKPVSAEESCIIIHNVITPNGDGTNDTWYIDCIENFPLNRVLIFDRWGDRINEFENYNNTTIAWNGTNGQGKPVPDGTYYYVLTIRDGGTHTGWVFVRGGSQ
jgi:gliding motility-associated-like protein/uncharacterized repeat protein (TIGR01451 family)